MRVLYSYLLDKLLFGYDVEDTEPFERFFKDDFNSVAPFVNVDAGFDLLSFCTVTVKTPSVDAFPFGLLILILTVDVVSLDDRCSLLFALWSIPAM